MVCQIVKIYCIIYNVIQRYFKFIKRFLKLTKVMLFTIGIFKICIYMQVSLQRRSIGAVSLNVTVVVILLELYINSYIVVMADTFQSNFFALEVIMHIW